MRFSQCWSPHWRANESSQSALGLSDARADPIYFRLTPPWLRALESRRRRHAAPSRSCGYRGSRLHCSCRGWSRNHSLDTPGRVAGQPRQAGIIGCGEKPRRPRDRFALELCFTATGREQASHSWQERPLGSDVRRVGVSPVRGDLAMVSVGVQEVGSTVLQSPDGTRPDSTSSTCPAGSSRDHFRSAARPIASTIADHGSSTLTAEFRT